MPDNTTDAEFEQLSKEELEFLKLFAGSTFSAGRVLNKTLNMTSIQEDPGAMVSYLNHGKLIADQLSDQEIEGDGLIRLKHHGHLLNVDADRVCPGCGKRHGFLQFSLYTPDEATHKRILATLESITVSDTIN